VVHGGFNMMEVEFIVFLVPTAQEEFCQAKHASGSPGVTAQTVTAVAAECRFTPPIVQRFDARKCQGLNGLALQPLKNYIW
jgi:hypothetical protein